ncbi:MAG TPA: pitrilysin family protein [Candidatus Acidoferrales bacterium]|nr:pitrilysin family protein [Candidatus Acidoferrales bacterium]
MRIKRGSAGKVFAFVVLLFGLGAALAWASVKVASLDLHDVKLANGLRVIMVVDHSAPVYSIDVCYNVGSRNERPGRTGFAHLFEHMMFEGSADVGKGEHFILIMNNGGGMNGTTNNDRTTYFEELPKNQLDLGLYLEADRMRSLNINKSNVDNQRNAVQEERRQGIDNQPYGRASLDLDNLSYDNFAYKHSVIGTMSDLNAATVQDVADFFRVYYAPNNAVLTLVGDFDPDEALAKVKKYFGAIPSQPPPPAVDLSEEPHYGERAETIYDPLARLPEIDVAYHVPPGDTPGTFAAQELAIIWGQGESSRFYQHLVKEKQLASSVSVFVDDRMGPSQFYISVNPRPGVKVEDLQRGLDDEIDADVKSGVTAAELAKAKTQLLRQFIEQRRSSLFTAILIGDYTVKFHDPGLINTILDKENAVTLDDVNAMTRKFILRDQRAVVTTLPAAAETSAAVKGAGR